MPKTKPRTTRATLLERLWNDMRYCPICGGKLYIFGGSNSQLKRCDEYHGVMKIVGKAGGHTIGVVLEIDEESYCDSYSQST